MDTVRGRSVEVAAARAELCQMTNRSPFRYLKTSPEIIRLAAMPCVRYAQEAEFAKCGLFPNSGHS